MVFFFLQILAASLGLPQCAHPLHGICTTHLNGVINRLRNRIQAVMMFLLFYMRWSIHFHHMSTVSPHALHGICTTHLKGVVNHLKKRIQAVMMFLLVYVRESIQFHHLSTVSPHVFTLCMISTSWTMCKTHHPRATGTIKAPEVIQCSRSRK